MQMQGAVNFIPFGDGFVPEHIAKKGGVADVVYGDDSILDVTFVPWKRHVEVKSTRTKPFYEDILCIRIATRGTKDVVFRPWLFEDDLYWVRFQEQWQAFKAQRKFETRGTLLKNWPYISVSQVAMYEAQNIFTVEQIASLSDGNVKVLGLSAHQLRTTARQYVEAMKLVGPVAEIKFVNPNPTEEAQDAENFDEEEEEKIDAQDFTLPFVASQSEAKLRRTRRTKKEMELARKGDSPDLAEETDNA